MDLTGLVDMNYFWWTFNKVLQPGMPFLLIFIAISAAGFLLATLIYAFKRMGKS